MNRIYEILTVMLLCLVGLGLSGSFSVPVLLFLVSTVVLLLTEIFPGRWFISVLIALLSLSCAWIPLMFCMVPLMVYCSMQEKRWYLATPSLLVFRSLTLDTSTATADPDSFLSALTQPLSGSQYLIASVGALIAIILYLRMSHLEEANKKLRFLRDEVAEKNEQLRSQNERLSEAQDNEIHLATLQERNRIAREIHDNVGHMLTRSLLQVGALLVATPEDNALHEPLEGLRDTLDQAMTSVRESVHDLHDESIDLQAIIEESVKPANERFKVTVTYNLPDTLPSHIRLGMAGIVREAVSNAIRHSDGDTLTILADEHPGFYELTIRDNGHNTSKAKTPHPGIGLHTMEERAQELHGRIRIDAEETGFTVALTIPK